MRRAVVLVSIVVVAAAAFGLVAGCGTDENPIAPARDYVIQKFQRGNPGSLRNEPGAGVDVSPGTVPPTQGGMPGEIIFSIEPAPTPVAPPMGYQPVGQPWLFGPEGLTFAQRARILLPVPNPNGNFILARLDVSSGEWLIVASLIVSGNTTQLAADVLHFSSWTVLSYTSTDPQAPGRIRFTNVDPTRWVSLCASNFTPRFPPQAGLVSLEGTGVLLAASGQTGAITNQATLIVPQGTWTFQATRTVPIGPGWTGNPDGWVQLTPIVVDTPGTGPMGGIDPSNWTGVTPGRAPCEPEPDFALGTGQVQITLSWDPAVDLDLRVTEPSGEEIFYGNTSSATGGQLDRDRVCATASTGDPENVFWNTGAPSGQYTVRVNHFSSCSTGAQSVPFRVRTVVGGSLRTYEGTVAPGETKTVATFTR